MDAEITLAARCEVCKGAALASASKLSNQFALFPFGFDAGWMRRQNAKQYLLPLIFELSDLVAFVGVSLRNSVVPAGFENMFKDPKVHALSDVERSKIRVGKRVDVMVMRQLSQKGPNRFFISCDEGL